MDRRKKLSELVKGLLGNENTALIKAISTKKTPSKKSRKSKDAKDLKTTLNCHNLTVEEKKLLFSRLMSLNTLNLFQKISIFDRFNLHCNVPLVRKPKYANYVEENRSQSKEMDLIQRSQYLGHRHKYNSYRKLHQYKMRQVSGINLDNVVRKLVKFTASRQVNAKTHTNGRADSEKSLDETMDVSTNATDDSQQSTIPIKCTTHIKHAVFCTGEFSHLLIACTENRLLIWNLLTLRLKSSLKISVDKITVDLYTSLVAAFTTSNDLYVFLPNTPIPLYQRSNLPKILGATWIPRRYPKPHSLTVDWQATTELYLLSEKQVRTWFSSSFFFIL